MNSHCKGCKHHSNAKHPKKSPLARLYNNWCCKFGNAAQMIYKHCILVGGKEHEKTN